MPGGRQKGCAGILFYAHARMRHVVAYSNMRAARRKQGRGGGNGPEERIIVVSRA